MLVGLGLFVDLDWGRFPLWIAGARGRGASGSRPWAWRSAR